jgi:hypothetical protein
LFVLNANPALGWHASREICGLRVVCSIGVRLSLKCKGLVKRNLSFKG